MEDGNENKQNRIQRTYRIQRTREPYDINDPRLRELIKKEREKNKVKIDQEEGYKYIGGIILIVLVIMVINFVSMV